MSSFAHLHLHSQFSLLDGANRPDDVLAAAKAAGMPAIALTDHGNMFGAVDFYNRARKIGIKPIIGMEAYVASGSRLARDRQAARSNHLVLLARNETGYRNLIRLTSRSYLEGFYYKPRIDLELLKEHSEGLIGLSACLQGRINEQILANREPEAEATAIAMREILGDENFYLEMQDHGIPDQAQANEVLRRISRRQGIPLVLTNDCHYLEQSDHFAHDVLLCIGTQRVLADEDRLRYSSDQFYLKTADEMFECFPKDSAALENTVAIAERCDLEIPMGEFHLPEFPVPAGYSLDSYFEQMVREGLEMRLEELRRFGSEILQKLSPEVYYERLRVESEIIRRMGFSGYFLIVWDFIRHAREHGIPVGPGRGSAAGSLVAYALRITDIDPLQHHLLFERFLNPERVNLPDIDIDFCQRRRGEVIRYVNDKYGRDRVAQIITFGTLGAKAVLRDVGRVMGVPYAKVDRIAKLIPDMTKSLSEAAKEVAPLAAEVESDMEVRQVVEVGSRLEGLTRHASLHAAGVVIAPKAIQELVPLYKTSKNEIVTQWDKDVLESLGLLKMDFLGLKTLTVIDDTVTMLRQQGVELDIDRVPTDDPATYSLFCDGRTDGIFQFESRGMKDLLRRAQPSKFEDLAAFNALYRPGALSVGMVDEYIKRKQGKKKVRYILPQTQPILEETYGVIAYQEQVMQIAVDVAGFSMGEADMLRKAMGKKSPEVMAEQKEKFLSGAEAKGVARRKAQALWEYIEPFAGYGFNKSHSVAYALLAYKTAYLKAHHPVTFMAAMLTSEMSSKDNVPKYIRGCREMEIPVLPPDINESMWSFTPVGDSIRFGLGAVKGIGEGAVEAILATRRRVGRFTDFGHFASEVDPRGFNQKVFESLVKAGCFDTLHPSRATLFGALDRVLGLAQRHRRDTEEGQGALFGNAPPPVETATTPEAAWSEPDRLRYEKEALGLYLTGNPLSEHEATLARLASHGTADLQPTPAGSVTIGGLVTRMRRRKIKSGPNAGRFLGQFVLEDLDGTVPVTVFADRMQECEKMLQEDAVVVVRGTLRDREGSVELNLESMETLAQASDRSIRGLELHLGEAASAADLLRLRDVLIEHAGDLPVVLRLRLANGEVRIAPQEHFKVRWDASLAGAIEEILGQGSVVQLT